MFETSLGSPEEKTYCSRKCSNSDRIISNEQKSQISKTLITYNQNLNKDNPNYICKYNKEIKNCAFCDKKFEVYTKVLKYCSKVCSTNARVGFKHSTKTKEKMSISGIKRIESIGNGWKPRAEPSYPEKIVASILDKLCIIYTTEYKIKRWFIDFADIEYKIALEIDGSQHDLPERKASDKRKDEYLISNGWKIFRIKWKTLTKDTFLELENKIIDIFQYQNRKNNK